MWKCLNCGTENDDSIVICETCAHKKTYDAYQKSPSRPNEFNYDQNNKLIIFAIIGFAIAQLFLFIASCIAIRFQNNIHYVLYSVINGFSFLVTLIALIQSINVSNRGKAMQTIIIYLAVFLNIIRIYDLFLAGFDLSNIFTVVIIISTLVTGILALVMFKKGDYSTFRIMIIIIGALTIISFFFTGLTPLLTMATTGSDPLFVFSLLSFCGIFGTIGGIVFLLYSIIVVTSAKGNSLLFHPLDQSSQPILSSDVSGSSAQKLKELKELRDSETITEEEYQEKRKKYIDDL
jgi:hypothetical protein